MNISELHQDVLDFLLRRLLNDQFPSPPLRFILRIENKGKKLDQGHWFYGQDDEVLLSFWTGTDWTADTPNIYFRIGLDGNCSLHFSSGDSMAKALLYRSVFASHFELKEGPGEMYKIYSGRDIWNSLDYFLKEDKTLIDEQVESGITAQYFDDPKNTIGFIDASDFQKWLSAIQELQRQQGSLPLPYMLSNFQIEGFPPIETIQSGQLPKDSPFIFFTGNNGSGKTSILRALALGLSPGLLEERYDPKSQWRLRFNVSLPRTPNNRYRVNSEGVYSGTPYWIPFCCYGASRLNIEEQMETAQQDSDNPLLHPFESLFSHRGIFRDINQWLVDLLHTGRQEDYERFNIIKKFLIDLIPNICDIQESPWPDTRQLQYFERDADGEHIERGVSFDQLSSGIKSIVVMLGDMIVRLFDEQKEITDVSRLAGIVLIDEIDIHLHPYWQRRLPQLLHEYFPYVQFIVTTHSPVPLLGAPRNSRIFVVKRQARQGVTLERLDHRIELGNLLPNTILTSPIFGLDKIVPESNSERKDIRTENTYDEILENDQVQERLKEIARQIRNEEDN